MIFHTQTLSSDLQLEEHNGYQSPLWSFVDDVCVAEPAAIENYKQEKRWLLASCRRGKNLATKHKTYSRPTNKMVLGQWSGRPGLRQQQQNSWKQDCEGDLTATLPKTSKAASGETKYVLAGSVGEV